MNKFKLLTLSLPVLFILSCASPEPPPKKTVFDPLLQPLQRAKDVQDTVDSHAEETRKAVDSQERGEKEP